MTSSILAKLRIYKFTMMMVAASETKNGVNVGYSTNSIMFNLINLILIISHIKQKLTCPISTGRSYSIVVHITTEDWIKDFLFLFPIIYLTPSRNRSNGTEKEKYIHIVIWPGITVVLRIKASFIENYIDTYDAYFINRKSNRKNIHQ